MKKSDDTPRTLQELSAEAGVPARTIRFYIARGLLPGPSGGGRGSLYSGEHLARLRAIKEQQAKGRMLAEIARTLDGGVADRQLPEPTGWWNYMLAEDVVVSVRAGMSPWRTKQVRAALKALAAQLRNPMEDDQSDR